jgi:parallel beta-helix repeat protein
MIKNKSKFYIFIISLVLLTISPILINSSRKINSNELITVRDTYEIDIQFKSDFETYKSSGNGSASNPYIIENLNLNLTDQMKGGISIFNTEYYFTIQNCVLIGDNDAAGILIWGAKNGIITNNKITNFQYGVQVKSISSDSSENINITNNNLTENYWRGIELSSLYPTYPVIDCDVINNTIRDQQLQSGCRVDWANNCDFINNTFIDNHAKGLWLDNTENMLVINNTANNNGDYGFLIEYTHHSNFSENTANGNPVDGFKCWDCLYNNFYNNSVIGNSGYGFQLFNVSHSSLINNTIKNNGDHGIIITYYSTYNIIKYNTILGNDGRCIFESTGAANNIIEDNVCDYTEETSPIPGYQFILIISALVVLVIPLLIINRKRKQISSF